MMGDIRYWVVNEIARGNDYIFFTQPTLQPLPGIIRYIIMMYK